MATNHGHHPARHIAVETMIARECHQLTAFDQALHLEEGDAHGDAHGFGFVGASDDTSVVAGKNHRGATDELGSENAFARNEEIIAVNDSYHGEGLLEPAARVFYCVDDVSHDAPNRKIIVVVDTKHRIVGIGRAKKGKIFVDLEVFDGKFAVDDAEGDIAVCGGKRSVDD